MACHRTKALLLLTLTLTSPTAPFPAAQGQNEGVPSITVRSQLVLVPTEVRTKQGEIIFGLQADDFIITSDGVPQKAQLDDSASASSLSLVVLVQCSRDAWREFPKLKGLSEMVDAIAGGSRTRVAIVDFGKEIELLTGLTDSAERRESAFAKLAPCPEDPGAGILDALVYANRLLDRDHASGRRLVLLVSETRDHGSLIKPEAALAALNRSNTVVDAFAFSPGKAALTEEAETSDGVAGGISGVLGMAVQAARKNAAKEISRETGGEYINFTSERALDQHLNTLANRTHNAYALSFTPRPGNPAKAPPNGFHIVTVTVPKYPDAVLEYRRNYWTALESTSSLP